MSHTINALALAYDGVQDRILAVVNPGGLDTWSCWLTRRIVLEMLAKVPGTLGDSSSKARQAPVEYRAEVEAFEKEAALAQTARAVSTTEGTVMRRHAPVAELVVLVTLKPHGERFRVGLEGDRGNKAVGIMSRPDLQRVLHMLDAEVRKAAWCAEPPAAAPSDQPAPSRRRRLAN